ncbi:MAG: hypothetical protein ABSA92_05985 [Candidatus Bathyarchaeia archaeon]
MPLDPYTGADRPDLQRRDSVGYFPSTEVSGLASGIYDLYASAQGYPETLVSSMVTILRAPQHPIKPHSFKCKKLHDDQLRLMQSGSIPLHFHYNMKPEPDCDCYCHKQE